MAFHDILLHIGGYPDPPAAEAIDGAIALAARLQARLSALAMPVRFPVQPNWLADRLADLTATAHRTEDECTRACELALEHFRRQADTAGVLGETLLDPVDAYEAPSRLAHRARTRDLCILLPGSGGDFAQTLVFESGRPVLLLGHEVATRLDRVVVAWDGGRAAARALADALPFLRAAAAVRVLTIVGDKPAAGAGRGQAAARHLAMHGIEAEVDEMVSHGRPVGATLEEAIQRQGADLLVMGAYGRSSLAAFVLGGATEHMLSHPRLAVCLSH